MAQINIKYVNPAKPDKKFGSLVDVDGTKYMCPANMVSQFRAGTTVDVPVQQSKWGVDLVNVIAGHAQATAPSTAAWSKPQPPVVSVAATGSMDRKDALIFITGLVGRAMGSGKFLASDMETLTNEAIKSWLFLKEQIK